MNINITLTENAARQIQKQLVKRGKGIGLKLGVKKAGCSGFTYVLDYADEIGFDQSAIEQYGIKVIVDNSEIAKLDGIELDYAKEGINEAFRFKNPNATGTCGCGESFTVDAQ